MNECLTTPQHEKQIGYWVSEPETHSISHSLTSHTEDITFASMTDDVYDTSAKIIIFPERERGKYHNLGTSVVNIVCCVHECNILFITV